MAEHDDDTQRQYESWKEDSDAGERPPRELFSQVTNVAVLLCYDMVDKLRWLEKDTLQRDEDEIRARLEHMTRTMEQLRSAYLTFADVDI